MNSKNSLRYAVAAALAGTAMAFAGTAMANQPPPAGNVIYSLTGQAISSTYQMATVNFNAGTTNTNLAFAFREDPAFLELSNVQMVDMTTGSSTNLVVNGNFSSVGSGSQPTGWSYLNQFGASYGGVVSSGCGTSGQNCYYDGAVQAYDAINQVIPTTVGDTYTLSFSYADTYGSGTYQPLSTNGYGGTGGNGRDMYVYAGASQPTPANAPEPGSLALLGAGVLALFGFGLRRRKQQAS